MYSFRDDYGEGAHPNIIKALSESNYYQEVGYGLDSYTKSAISKIKKLIGNSSVDVHLISGGTQTNLIAISSFLRPHEACIAVDSGHIATHETGAIECTGHKVITVKAEKGKITTSGIKQALEAHPDEHAVKPKLVYISNPTELGTVYTKEELTLISKFCKDNNLILYVDGARLGSALVLKEANLSLSDMSKLTDAFFIGGTKNGALLGEALVINNSDLKEDFRYFIKQKGALLAKGRVLGIQFDQLFNDNLYFKLAEHSNNMAHTLREGIKEAGYKFFIDSPTNQIFPIIDNLKINLLKENFDFLIWQKIDESHSAIRLVTSWATKEEFVTKFIKKLKE